MKTTITAALMVLLIPLAFPQLSNGQGSLRDQLRNEIKNVLQQPAQQLRQQVIQPFQQPQRLLQEQPFQQPQIFQQPQPQLFQQPQPLTFGQTVLQNQPQQQGQLLAPRVQLPLQIPQVLSSADLRDIDQLVVYLSGLSRQLHDDYHDHFEGVRHVEKLDDDVTELERMADALHLAAVSSNGDAISAARLRSDTNSFIQQSVRIQRSIDLAEPWVRGPRDGFAHMRQLAGSCLEVALAIDRYMPVDTAVIDSQTAVLEASIKELHDEFHEHLEGYEVSAALDHDLENLESLVEHMHDLAHGKAWGQVNFQHLFEDVNKVRQETAHIESMFVRQAQIGVRTRDWVGIEHSRDAITDVLASAYLLEHMIRKTAPPAREQRQRQVIPSQLELDRHGHPVRPRRDRELDHRH